MKIIITTTQVPFIYGGAEILAETLKTECLRAGHEAEIVTLPFREQPPEQLVQQMLAWRTLDLTSFCGQRMDRMICLKFPAYLTSAPKKNVWLLHQHRAAYDLWGGPFSDLFHSYGGASVRDAVINADNKAFGECSYISTISKNVSSRLWQHNRVRSETLYPPPKNLERFRCEAAEDYFFFPSRLTEIKRQEMVIHALTYARNPVRVVFAGTADNPAYLEHLRGRAAEYGVQDRVTFLGPISEEDKFGLYARSLGVVYPPLNEDYGYVTLEAMLSSKSVITCRDSGGPTEFVRDRENGRICEPTGQSIAQALDELWDSRPTAKAWGIAAKESMERLNLGWKPILEKLLS